MLAIAAFAVFLRSSTTVDWHALPLFVALFACVPFVQFFAGLQLFSGQAWVTTAYLLGLLLVLLLGAQWELATPGHAADGLFFAIGIASFLSVGLQLRQWLDVPLDFDSMQVWAVEFSPGRPAANLGQPNQLATLLIWGLLGCAWGVTRKKIGPTVAVLGALYLLFGIVLTQSRVAYIALFVIVIAAWIGRRGLPSRMPVVVTCLLLYFAGCTFYLQHLSDLLGLNVLIRSATFGGESTHLRLQAYILFFDAIGQQPWWGFGWNQLAAAQLSVAQSHPTLGSFFMHSHNLFLDLVLWCGIPIGSLVSVLLVLWLIRGLRSLDNTEDVILMLFVLVVGLHAMVELPLHHAYFLLPTGLVMGILNQRFKMRVILTSTRWSVVGLLLGASLLLGVIMRDYLEVDASFRRMRLDAAHIGRLPPGDPPNVVILNDMRELIVYARKDVKSDISVEELERLRRVTIISPTPSNLFNVAKGLALRHQPADAIEWIQKMQNVQPAGFDRDLRAVWEAQAKSEPAMAEVKWPAPQDSVFEQKKFPSFLKK